MTGLYPGITAGQAREIGELIAAFIPDEAILVVDRVERLEKPLPDGRTVIGAMLVNARWEWDEDQDSLN